MKATVNRAAELIHAALSRFKKSLHRQQPTRLRTPARFRASEISVHDDFVFIYLPNGESVAYDLPIGDTVGLCSCVDVVIARQHTTRGKTA